LNKEQILLGAVAFITGIIFGYDMIYTDTKIITNFVFTNVWILLGLCLILVFIAKLKEKNENNGKWKFNKLTETTIFAFLFLNLMDVFSTVMFMKELGINAEINMMLKWMLHSFGFHAWVFFAAFVIITLVLYLIYYILPEKAAPSFKWFIIIAKVYIILHNVVYF